MDADFSIELGPPSEEAVLEYPWASPAETGPAYFDLKRQPELLPFIAEAVQYPELGEFLRVVNSDRSPFATAKCDVWSTDELDPAEDIYGGDWKLACYVDLVFSDGYLAERFSFFHHEDLVRSLTELLKKAPEIPAACEAVVRRCYYHQPPPGEASTSQTVPDDGTGLHAGFYFTLYLSGYGEDEEMARQRWQVTLRLVANALLQLSGKSANKH